MLGHIAHIGITVTDMEKSVVFYNKILGLKITGQIEMKGEESDRLFGMKNSLVKLTYLSGTEELMSPPVELIQFVGRETKKLPCSLTQTSISEICFACTDIDKVYEKLQAEGVECLSGPEFFDFSEIGFGKSKAFYFKDPDGIILEVIQDVD